METERTVLRRLTTGDAENLYALNLDADVVKFTGDRPFENIGEARRFLAGYDQYEKYGVGRLAVIEKSTSAFLGWCGMKYSQDSNEYDIGFRFHKHCWNKGFATETARKCIDAAFNEMGIGSIVGRAMKENSASIKVLEKLGLTFKEAFDFDGKEGVVYELKKETYLPI